jgi:hypothetical protein
LPRIQFDVRDNLFMRNYVLYELIIKFSKPKDEIWYLKYIVIYRGYLVVMEK